MTTLLAAAEASTGERLLYAILAGILVALLVGITWNWKGRGK